MASVTFESFIEKHNIEIPTIQRDYVQGRGFTIEEQDKREAFVSKLINALSNDAKRCHLEFIYGAVNKISHSFIPLDGQQRLTTLFLLHWVVWNMSGNDAKVKYPLSMISGFKYETRLSSLAFCRNMINRELITVKGAKSIGQQLRKQPWFSEEWNYDPTIMAMISMIEFMEEKLHGYNDDEISKMLAKLCSDDNVISFDELNMSDYDLTDSLYIKMNARGKQLTSFENWKSDFIKFLDKEFGNDEYSEADKNRKSQSYSYKDYFCYSIEHQWTDLFWTYLTDDYLKLNEEEQQKQYPCIDKMFMNLFDYLCMYHYYVQGKVQIEYSKANASIKRKIWQNKRFVDFLFCTLDSLYRIGFDEIDNRIDHTVFFDKLFYISDNELPTENTEYKVRLFRTKQCNLFKLCVDNGSSMELTDILLFYALLNYCNTNHTCYVDDALKSYMRNVRNYFESEIQNLKTRTSVQSNLRLSEFDKYNSKINNFLELKSSPLSKFDCIIDDCSITYSNTKVFNKSIETFGSQSVVSALKSFCDASQSDRVRLLIACGFKGTYLSDCIGRKRYFFGNEGKWDVLFISDKEQLSECFANYTSKVVDGKDNISIIKDKMSEQSKGFAYYMLKYADFLEANNSRFHFAIKDDLDDVDWIALGSYSSNPGTAYHADPLAVAVKKELEDRNINLSLYKQYSGKSPLSIVKDKNNWEQLFSVISRNDGWHITKGGEFLTEDIKLGFNIQERQNQDKVEFVIPKEDRRDMVQICVELIIKVSKMLEAV